MPDIAVTTTPIRLDVGLGIDPLVLAAPDRALLWSGWIENIGAEVIYLRRSPLAPDPQSEPGARLPRGSRRRVRVYSGDPFGDGVYWVWTIRNGSALLAEEASNDC